MKARNPRRQIYNKQQLTKQAQKNRQITGQFRIKKKNISQEIVKEIEKEENDIEMKDEKENEKAGESEKNEKSENENEKEEKEPKKKIERLKLDAKTLLYNRDCGLRKYYEVITNTEFKNKDVSKNLDKLINITRNWHFMLFPNYDFDYFTNKIIALGKQAPTKSFMSRLRRIYKGELKWDVIYDEQDQILGKASLMNEDKKEFENPNPEKDINDIKIDNNDINNNDNQNKEEDKEKLNVEKNKKEETYYNEEEQGFIRDLFLKDEILDENNDEENKEKKENNYTNKNDEYDVKDSDFDNFPEDYNPEEEFEKQNKNKKNIIDINGIKIDGNEKPDLKEINNIIKEKRTSLQIENKGDIIDNVDMRPESMNKKIILDK